jgi:hypothetical protein
MILEPALRSCEVPMTALYEAPFNLIQNEIVQVKAQAKNTNDWGELSEANTSGGIIQTIPYQMEVPIRGYDTSFTTLFIDWIALTGDKTGSATIDSYNLQWYDGNLIPVWTDLTGLSSYSTATTGQFSAGVVAGTIYQVRVRAHNVHGWSDFSPILEIKAAGIPEQPEPPTTEINN